MKKTIFLISFILFILFTLFTAFYFYQKGKKLTSPVTQVQPTAAVEEYVNLNNQAGFSIKYPKSLTFNPHDEDNENYAHLEFSYSGKKGKLIVWVKDADQYADIDKYLKMNKLLNPIDSSLGDLPSKKTLSGDYPKILRNSLLKDGYLYEIEVDLGDDSFWQNIYENINSSFVFTEASQDSISNEAPVASSEEDFEGVSEEIIE